MSSIDKILVISFFNKLREEESSVCEEKEKDGGGGGGRERDRLDGC